MTNRPGSLRIIRADHLQRKPWKNNGGTTADLAAFPPQADLDAFDWRVSMADVEASGPFSTFPGIDRTLVLLHGDGVELNVDGQSFRVDDGTPVSFPGDAATVGTLIGGSVRDLNVMTRRGRFAHRVAVVGPGAVEIAVETILVAHEGPCLVSKGGDLHRLAPLDALQVWPACQLSLDNPMLQVRLIPTFAGSRG